MPDEKKPAAAPKLRSIDLHGQHTVLGIGPVSTISQNQSGLILTDRTTERFVIVTSSDERQKDFVKIPYESIKQLRYAQSE